MIVIIAALIAMALPVVQKAREMARRTTCSNNVRQLALAALNYESVHQQLPPGVLASPISGRTYGFWPSQPGFNKPNYIGTKVFLLPFLELAAIDRAFATNRNPAVGDQDAWWKFPAPHGAAILESASRPIDLFLCPADRGHKHAESLYVYVHAHDTMIRRGRILGKEYLSRTNYMSCAGALGAPEIEPLDEYWHLFTGVYFNRSEVQFGHIVDGTSNVIAFGETASNTVSSNGTPADYSWVCDGMPTAYGIYDGEGEGGHYYQFKSKHAGHLISVSMVDGSSHFMTPKVSVDVLHKLSGKADGYSVRWE